jgi:hypothetical protein
MRRTISTVAMISLGATLVISHPRPSIAHAGQSGLDGYSLIYVRGGGGGHGGGGHVGGGALSAGLYHSGGGHMGSGGFHGFRGGYGANGGNHWRHGFGIGAGYLGLDPGADMQDCPWIAAPALDMVGSTAACCESRFRSNNPANGAYIGDDGLQHRCP